MSHHYLTNNLKLNKNKYNIYEPEGNDYLVFDDIIKKIDVIILPTLGFDKNNRIGKGKVIMIVFYKNINYLKLKCQ